MRFLLILISGCVVIFAGCAALFPPVFDPMDAPVPPGINTIHERTAPLNDATVELCYYVWTRGCA